MNFSKEDHSSNSSGEERRCSHDGRWADYYESTKSAKQGSDEDPDLAQQKASKHPGGEITGRLANDNCRYCI